MNEPMPKMDPNRFVVSERVMYVNHVTGENLGTLVVQSVSGGFVIARPFFGGKEKKFNLDGTATWSSNLSIRHEP